MLKWTCFVDMKLNIMYTDYDNSSLAELCSGCPVKQKLEGMVCVSEQGWPCVCAPTLAAAVFLLSSIHVSRTVWLKGTGLCTPGANGSVDKKSSLLLQIHRLNVTSRATAALRANGSKTQLWVSFGSTLLSLWSHVAEYEWRLLFKSHCIRHAF